MKKFMALLCAGVLACSMNLVVFAAPSPSTSDTADNEVVGNSTVDEVRVWDEVLVDGVATTGKVSVAEASEAKEAEAAAQAKAISAKASVLEVVEVSFDGSFKKITIPFNVKNVVAGQNIVVLHQKADGTWETITPDKVENGKVTATFTSLSPVAFVAVDGAAVTSPKTADAYAAAIAMVAVVSLAGAAVAGKKAFN